ncbi:MAG: hypothetical protein ACYDCK_13520 [Thermoplasmatota archaeon]
MSAISWPEADALFRSDPCWVGSDGAPSVDLGDGRIAWLFSDSLVKTLAGVPQANAPNAFVHNTIGIQQGRDPSSATMEFFWRNMPALPPQRGVGACSAPGAPPASFFPEDGPTYFWIAGGALVDGKLLIFMSGIRSNSTKPFDFYYVESRAVVVDNPKASPPDWAYRNASLPRVSFHADFGQGTFVDGAFLYSFADIGANRHALVRWFAADASSADLSHPQWWNPRAATWQANLTDSPNPIAGADQPQLAVLDDAIHGWVMTECDGFGAAKFGVRLATAPEGPWSPLAVAFRPPEDSMASVLVYSCYAHPGLSGGPLVASYYANSTSGPRFVRVAWR